MNKNNLSKRASLLHITSQTLANGMRSGNFRSLYRGQGIEFLGVREYLRGDDIRSIDWNVTARMGKTYVKVFEEEKELDVFVILDKSSSMETGSGLQSRLDSAIDCASLLTLASLHNSSPMGAVIFDGKIQFSCSPERGKNQAMLLVSQYEKDIDSPVNGSCLENALRGAEKLLRKRTLVFIISDFRSDGWLAPFGRLCQKNDVVALRIVDALDDNLPSIGSVSFVDTEIGVHTDLPTSSSKFSRQWRDANIKRINTFRQNCVRHGAIPLILNTNQDPASELIKFFTSREQRI